VTPDPLALIYGRCLRTVDECADTLRDKLTSEEDDTDSTEARAALTRAMKAAETLRDHLDSAFDFTTGQADPREVNIAAN